MTSFQIKRAYEEPAADDGWRVLVDRLWPRGLKKEAAELDAWLKDVAPTPDLRTWWDHDPDRMEEFAARYRAELDDNPALDQLRRMGQVHDTVTLLYAARDTHVNHARVLVEVLRAPRVAAWQTPR